MTDNRKGEILAPVGNFDMLYAAVRCGADAVYLGTKEFSARRNAENFTKEELKEAIDYCHIRGVKVYLALNIQIKETELPSAFSVACYAYNSGIDGVIIADLGLAYILHKNIPRLPLHASTQMSVYSPSALPLLKELGFSRVVVAREMSLKELGEFCAEAKKYEIEVEAFVHGALCMCVSGQCLLSAFLGSRSGNRGLCAGPCRLPFAVQNGTGYDLSLKDLSYIEYIKELSEMGVCSFKIEGRMKRPEYVAAAVSACRQAIYKENIDIEIFETLKDVFSRSGFTDGYLKGKLGREMFGIRTKDDVMSANEAFPKLHTLYRNENSRVPIRIKAQIIENEPIKLEFCDSENRTVTVTGEMPQKAQSKPLSLENAKKNLCKLGGTPYYKEGFEIDISDNVFVSAGELNGLRRQAVEELNLERCKVDREEVSAEYTPNKKTKQSIKQKRIFARFESETQIPQDIKGVDAVILPLEENPERIVKLNLPIIADIPRGFVDEKYLEERLEIFKSNGSKIALCGNLASLKIAREQGFEVIPDIGMNIANSESLSLFFDWGTSKAVISCEQTVSEINSLSTTIEKGIVGYGKLPLMLFRNCPLKNGRKCSECDKNGVITDRLGTNFPVRCRKGGVELFNSVPVWLADRMNEFDCDFVILYFTDESPDRVKEVINSFHSLAEPDIKHTRGLYYRGTI